MKAYYVLVINVTLATFLVYNIVVRMMYYIRLYKIVAERRSREIWFGKHK